MNIKIRKYKNEDLNDVNSILKESFDIEKNNFNKNIFKEIVACANGKVCGYLLLTKVLNPIKNKYYLLVDYVCVSSSYRNMGIAKKMMDYVDEYAKKEKFMYIQLTCSYKRVEAHKLYEKCGYIKRESDIFRKEI